MSSQRHPEVGGGADIHPLNVDEKRPNPSLQRAGQKSLMLVALACAVVSALYWPSLASLAEVWQTQNHRHAFLVLGVSAWLLWRNRGSYDDNEISGSLLGVCLVLGCVWVWVIANVSLVSSLEHLATLVLFGAVSLSVVGWKVFRATSFAFFYLLLAFPIGDSLIPALMEVTADVAQGLVHAAGLSIYRDGSIMVMPGGSFVIADVCAGFGQLSTGVTIGVLFAYLTFQRVASRMLFVLVLAAVLVAENGLRAYLVMAIASGTDMQHMAGKDHIVFGWVLFGLTLLAMFWAGQRIARLER